MARRRASESRWIDAAPVFAALGDPTRLRIVARLSSDGPLSIARLTEGTQVSRQAVTKHLASLSGAGLVRSEYVGRECVWELAPRRLAQARGHLEAISRQWDDAVERLRSMVDDGPE